MVAGYWLYRKGRRGAAADQLEGILDDLEESQKVRRDVDREPDPAGKLSDDWER